MHLDTDVISCILFCYNAYYKKKVKLLSFEENTFIIRLEHGNYSGDVMSVLKKGTVKTSIGQVIGYNISNQNDRKMIFVTLKAHILF